MPDTGEGKIEKIKENLNHVFTYIENLERLDRKPVFDIAHHKNLALYEHEVKDLPGFECWSENNQMEPWFKVKRLEPTFPPCLPEQLFDWVELTKSPEKEPVLKTSVEAAANGSDAKKKPGKNGDKEPQVFVLNIEDAPEVQKTYEYYIENAWKPWAEIEKRLLNTIKIYEDLFKFEHQSTEQSLELIVGIGVLRWKTGGVVINYPLITKTVEAVLDPESKTIAIYPAERDPISELEMLQHVNIAKIAQIEENVAKMMAEGESEIMPFESESFKAILDYASANIDSKCISFSGRDEKGHDQPLPEATKTPLVTDSWILFIRQRKTNFIAEDIKRLRSSIATLPEIPASSGYIVTEPEDKIVNRPGKNYRGISSIGFKSWSEGHVLSEAENLYFPKPFNQKQVSIAERLEAADGVVVQGPPGTGKTHTIANIICHFSSKRQKGACDLTKRGAACRVKRPHTKRT